MVQSRIKEDPMNSKVWLSAARDEALHGTSGGTKQALIYLSHAVVEAEKDQNDGIRGDAVNEMISVVRKHIGKDK